LTTSRNSSQGKGAAGRALADAIRGETSWWEPPIWPLADVECRLRVQRYLEERAYCLSIDVIDPRTRRTLGAIVRHLRGAATAQEAVSWMTDQAGALLVESIDPDPF
jgi:hypothetical protein